MSTKTVAVETTTFDQLVEYGRSHTDNVVNGMPWAFSYRGHAVTHENDDCYLITALGETRRFERGDVLVTSSDGMLYPINSSAFFASPTKASDMNNATPAAAVSAETITMGQILRIYRESKDATVVRAAMLVMHGDPIVVSFVKPTPAMFEQAMILLAAAWNAEILTA